MSRAPLLALLVLTASIAAPIAASTVGCAAAKSDAPLVGIDENAPPDDRASESLTGDVPAGSTLITTGNLNLRDGPSTAHAILRVIPSGASVTVVDAAPVGGWYHIDYAGTDGWSIGTYLKNGGSGGGGGGGGGTTVKWSCGGSWGTTQASDGKYFLTAFGCWVDASGVSHGDPGDDCIPGCLSQAKAEGLCDSGDTGKACEERVTWYVADAGRFGCGARVKITNPANGKAVVGVALDYGPACWVERNVSEGVLDASGRIDRYLFGSDMGASDRAAVHVEVVPKSTPLGPN
jgi:hypothetical protein